MQMRNAKDQGKEVGISAQTLLVKNTLTGEAGWKGKPATAVPLEGQVGEVSVWGEQRSDVSVFYQGPSTQLWW